ncbi:cold-shock protein [Amylibacter ulvae]|uniref:Cold-shock protein n=1 Tax=Paramylibacter ulvae TaxID=1651968 RepID=A0ABQ3CXK3_9RHOB|nr:cold shock domain-containing protein [Amylibacter ulvae]GHA45879.1 cold-shock protein [Amylibacter ulvae]
MIQKTGKIKWFDTAKGFGFVVDDHGGADILLHANVLRDFGLSSVVENSVIVAETVETERGQQVTKIVSLDLPDAQTVQSDMQIPQGDFSALPLLAARAKWFDKTKGFGFVNVFGSSDDIFLHVEVLRAYGMAELQQGEAIAIKLSDGPRGKMVVEVRPWDFAIPR